jgi:glycosyltransferase involved in cell wall biosynthesis
LSIGWNAVLRIHKDDKILVVTNPPLLPFIVRFVCFLKRAKYVLLVHDVYPDVFVPLGIMRETNLFFRIMSWVNGRLYLSADSVVCLGRDMARLVANKAGSAENIVIIPNWGDIDAIKPTPKENNKFLKELNLTDKFVVHYSGNHGRTHDLLSLIEAADILKNQEGIHFLFIGEGGGKGGAISRAQELGLKNITFLTFVDRSELNSSLNASDISVVAFKKGMAGISVPSRLYNLMAAGKPILAVVDVDSEVAEVIREAELGVIVPPAESSLLAEQILKLKNSYKNRLRMGRKSRNEVESKYSYFVIQRQYRDLFDKL